MTAPTYQPGASNTEVEPPLRIGQSLTIGYGAGGSKPWRYYLPDGPELGVEIGYLQIFLSNKHIDFSHMVQKSPLTSDGSGNSHRGRGHGGGIRERLQLQEDERSDDTDICGQWDVMTFIVDQGQGNMESGFANM